MYLRRFICFLFWSFLFIFPFSGRTEPISVYMYHEQAPFVLGKEKEKKGLIFEAIELFNKESKFPFELTLRPRARLNIEIKNWIENKCPTKIPSPSIICNNNWIVFGVSPQWGWGEKATSRYLWGDLFTDQDLIITSSKSNLEYTGPLSMKGKVFASVTGRHCPPKLCQELESGQIKREDGLNSDGIVARVFYQRADFALMQKSHLDYLFKFDPEQKKYKDGIHISKMPLDTFMLKIMIPENRPDLYEFFEKFVKTSEWKKLLIKYGI